MKYKYNDSVRVKTGFYKGVKGLAKGYDHQTGNYSIFIEGDVHAFLKAEQLEEDKVEF